MRRASSLLLTMLMVLSTGCAGLQAKASFGPADAGEAKGMGATATSTLVEAVCRDAYGRPKVLRDVLVTCEGAKGIAEERTAANGVAVIQMRGKLRCWAEYEDRVYEATKAPIQSDSLLNEESLRIDVCGPQKEQP